jgi:hypothetical protein
MFSTISALEIARQHSKVNHDSNNSKSPDITKFGHFGVPKTTLKQNKTELLNKKQQYLCCLVLATIVYYYHFKVERSILFLKQK